MIKNVKQHPTITTLYSTTTQLHSTATRYSSTTQHHSFTQTLTMTRHSSNTRYKTNHLTPQHSTTHDSSPHTTTFPPLGSRVTKISLPEALVGLFSSLLDAHLSDWWCEVDYNVSVCRVCVCRHATRHWWMDLRVSWLPSLYLWPFLSVCISEKNYTYCFVAWV